MIDSAEKLVNKVAEPTLVLVVEHDDAQRRLLMGMIRDEGYSPAGFADGSEAIVAMRPGVYAAAIIDQRASGTSSNELVERLKGIDPALRIIVHTAHGSFHSAKEALNLGVFAYVEQNGEPAELMRHLQRAVQSQLFDSLRDTEQRLAQMYRQANDGIFIVDPDNCTIIDVNARGASMLGYSVEDLEGNSLSVIHPHDLPRVMDFFEDVLKRGSGFTDQVSCMTKSGKLIPAECSAAKIRDQDADRLLIIVRDVRERRRAEEALKASEKQLRLVADNTSAMLAYVDVSHRYRFVNQRFVDFFRRPYEEIIGARVPDVVGEQTYQSLIPFLEKALAGDTTSFELQRELVTGETSWIHATYVPDFGENGKVRGCFAALYDINERKQAERALRDSEAQLRLIADNISALLAYVDDSHVYRFVNRRFLDFFEKTQEQVLGARVPEIVGEDSYKNLVPYLEKALGGETVSFELERTSPSGVTRWIYATYVPDFGNDGAVRGCFAALYDVSERKEAEQALKNSEAQLRLIADNVSAMLCYVDKNYRYQFANKRFADFFGRPVSEIVGASIPTVIDDDVYRSIRPYLERVMAGETVTFEQQRRSPVLGLRWIAATLVPDISPEGEVRGYYGLLSDVTERRKADEALRESESLMRAIFEHSPVAINLKDTEGRYLLVNKKWENLAGRGTSELVGKTVGEVLPGALANDYRLLEQKVLSTGRSVEGEFQIPTQYGERAIHVIKFPIIDDDGSITGIGSISTDVTESKEALEALAESEERYQGLYDDAPDMYFTIAKDGTIRSVNQFGADYLGFSKDELIGSSVTDLIYPDDRNSVAVHFQSVFEDNVKESQLEFRKLRKDGSVLWVNERIRLLDERNGSGPELRIVCRDVTEAHQLSEELSFQATHDSLTGLVNRRELEQRLARLLESSRAQNFEHALCYMDLDQFKVINDTCGHVAGDELLRQLGEVLPGIVRRRDTLARLGGDEFAVLMEHCPLDQAQRVANALRGTVEEFRFAWEDKTFNIGASIGLVPINADSRSVTDVLSAADTACYMAKDQGRNRIYVYDPSSLELARRHGEMEWVSRIHQALEEDRFELYYQPIESANTPAAGYGTSMYYELLLRMRGPENALVYPGAFLPAAERFNLSARLDRWVVSNAFACLKANPGHLDELNQCAINLSGLSLTDLDFHRFVMHQFQDLGIPGDKICFEVTETAAISNLTSATRFISAVKARGCSVALDDFGSGLSSFAYLKHLSVDYLKIDGVFVKDIVWDPIDFAMVKSINEVGQVMGKKTVAEFVEDEAVLEKLRSIGVDFVQGYSIGRPAPFSSLLEAYGALATKRGG